MKFKVSMIKPPFFLKLMSVFELNDLKFLCPVPLHQQIPLLVFHLHVDTHMLHTTHTCFMLMNLQNVKQKREERLLKSMSQTKIDIQLNVPRSYEDTVA